MKSLTAIVAALAVAVLCLSGCSAEPGETAQQFAAVVAGQPHVVSAVGYGVATWTPDLDLTVEVDPDVSDDDLRALMTSTVALSQQHHWGVPYAIFTVGRYSSVSTGATESEVTLFNGLRHDPRYVGVIDDGGFRVRLSNSSADLSAEWSRLVESASTSGQPEGFGYSVYSTDGTVAISGDPQHPPTATFAEWRSLATSQPIDEVSGWSGEGAEKLDLWVADEATLAAITALAATQKVVEVHIYITGTNPDGSCMCSWRWP